jgi:hypothetical protein
MHHQDGHEQRPTPIRKQTIKKRGKQMTRLKLGLAIAASMALGSVPANATLEILLGGAGGACVDQDSCDLDTTPNHIAMNTIMIGDIEVTGASAARTDNTLSFSDSTITNLSGTTLEILQIGVVDTDFTDPMTHVQISSNFTLNNNIVASRFPPTTVSFFLDRENRAPIGGFDFSVNNGAGVFGTFLGGLAVRATDEQQSFFLGFGDQQFQPSPLGPYSMSEVGVFVLAPGGSVTDLTISMETNNAPVPEPSTWAMLITGTAFLGFVKMWKSLIHA